MNTPKQLLRYLVEELNFPLNSICELHKPCATTPRCSYLGVRRYVNLDDVKTSYCSRHGIASCASVDGMTALADRLLFVEIKGWADFLKYQTKEVEQKIRKQVLGYDFVKKLQDSLSICNEYASEQAICTSFNLAYVIVTDIDTAQHPLQTLQGNLMALAQTSSSYEYLCNEYMMEKIDSIKGVETYYKRCCELDDFILHL